MWPNTLFMQHVLSTPIWRGCVPSLKPNSYLLCLCLQTEHKDFLLWWLFKVDCLMFLGERKNLTSLHSHRKHTVFLMPKQIMSRLQTHGDILTNTSISETARDMTITEQNVKGRKSWLVTLPDPQISPHVKFIEAWHYRSASYKRFVSLLFSEST